MATDPTSPETHGYHLFLEPEGSIRDACADLIQAFASEYGGPVFPPHITLAARIEVEDENLVLEKARELAQTLTPFELRLGEPAGEASFFRALYLLVPMTPELRHAHARAREHFGLPEGNFVPHLSLFYGLITDSTRDAMKERVTAIPDPLRIDRLTVYRTEGTADRWEQIGAYPFAA